MKRLQQIFAIGALAALYTGCAPDEPEEVTSVRPIKATVDKFEAEAGLEPGIDDRPGAQALAVANRKDYGYRWDGFAMLPVEKSFDKSQAAARLLSELGGFGTMFEEPTPPEEAAPPVVEPLPNWRLSGVLLSDGVVALLDMGNKVVDIRPGQRVPDTEWTVMSIDTERAVLYREGNKLPKWMAVPLAGPGGGAAGGGTGGGTGGTRGTGGGSGTPKGGGGSGPIGGPDD